VHLLGSVHHETVSLLRSLSPHIIATSFVLGLTAR
jgi:hypothetical protein